MSAEHADRVVIRRENAVAHVVLSRAERRNGLDVKMFRAIDAAARALDEDRGVRAVVLSGEGPSFCAGLDFAAFLGDPAGSRVLLERGESSPANLAQRAAWAWQELRVPVIAALHGAVYGGGFQIALAADMRIAARDVAMCAMEIEYGLVPDMSISQTLLRWVRHDVAAELMFTGEVVGAARACELGLVTRVVEDPVAEALRVAGVIAQKSPDAVCAAKRLLRDSVQMSRNEALLLETELQLKLLGSKNQLEAVAAKLAKRTANFKDTF